MDRNNNLRSYKRIFLVISLIFIAGIIGFFRSLNIPRPEITLTSATVCPNGKILSSDISASDFEGTDLTAEVVLKYESGTLVAEVKDKNNLKTIKRFDIKAEDTTPPVLSISEPEHYEMFVGETLELEEITATDNCDEISVEVSGDFDPNTPGTYTLTYTATDSSENISQVTREIVVSELPKNNGIIYLTFDDGPGPHTDRLLDILKKYDVKATFFVTSAGSDDSIRRADAEGHTIGLHTSSHNYAYIYSSVEAYFDDLYEIKSRVENITGKPATLIRFPGGSSNTVSASYDGGIGIMSILSREVEARGFTYFDWNITSGDAGGAYSSEEVSSNVINNLRWDGVSVVLQHDIKSFSVDAVESIITYGLSHGYTFLPLSPSSPTSHHGINN